MSTIQVGGQLQPGTVDTPLDARVRVDTLSAIASIPLPFVGMTFFVKATGKLYVVKSLKSKQIGPVVTENAAIDEYEELPRTWDDIPGKPETFQPADHEHTTDEITGLEDVLNTATARPASITLPVPFDENDDNVSLVVDFSEDETFPEDEFTRVTMSVHHAKMRVFSGEKYVSIDETCVGKPYYGQSVTFTLDDEMFPGYVAGKTYFARYSWVDSQGGFSEWRGFKFTADVVDFEPIRIPLLSSTKVKAETTVSGELHLDYLEGGIQNYTMYDDVTIALENVSNVPFAEALVVNMRRTGGTLTVKRGTVSQTYSADKTYMIAVTNFGALNIIVTETI